MRTATTLSYALLLLLSHSQSDAAEVVEYPIQEFLSTTNYSGASFSPDNSKVLVSSDESGIFNAYSLPVDGGPAVALTNSTKESVFALSYFPGDERFLYTADQGGNELNHIYVRELNGSVVDLTPGENLKATFYGWAQDDNSFYLGTNERDRRFFDVYEVQVDAYSRQMIFRNDGGYVFGDVAPDGGTIAFTKVSTRDDSDIYLYNRKTEKITHVTPHDGQVNHYVESFSPDAKGLYFTTDADSEFVYLVRHDLPSGQRVIVTQPSWDVSSAGFSKHGKYLVVSVNEDARTQLKLYDAETMEPVALPELPQGNVTSVGISRDESHLAFYVSSGRMPRDLFYHNFDSDKPRQLTRSLSRKIEPRHLVDGEVVRFKSFDGLEVPGVLYKPHQANATNKAPALVWVHGGPGGQSRLQYRALIQYLVNHGYVIYAINNRGSSGYGKTFQQADDQKHGEGDLDDCVASKQMLIETGYVDSGRIGIIGGSYGGYMVLAASTFRPNAFQAGVDIFGISNWYRTVQNIPPWWEAQRASLEKEMGDFDDKEYFESISPLFHADQIKRPLMVLQGANDPRVLKIESDEIVAAVRANNVPVEYVVFDDEGHGFRKKKNQAQGYEKILRFLDEHLGR